MGTKNNTKIYGREELKEHFRNGKLPTEHHFAHLIDSTINKQEDGFSKDEENGMVVAALGTSKRLVSFYRTNDDLEPFFLMEKDEREYPGLRMQPHIDTADVARNDDKSFFFHMNGNMGVGTRCNPCYKLEVSGFVAMEGRVGTYLIGKVPADGNWYPIISGLDNCQAFEVIARTGKRNSGRFAILHAFAVSAFGRSCGSIRKASSHYGFFWNRLRLRWKGGNHHYALQLRTNSNYGPDVEIYYRITRLWDDTAFMPKEYYH
ncbi:adhesin [Chitinophaga agri]|uniref:Adhesin n=1 Tax=Chitinophaga agri TaxID=2703787 RepID=A0A6B9ZE94_9BACT|nr:adhesin [Chitinophaga agri]QHS58853.1 adhesin [Chitinophaga agri]